MMSNLAMRCYHRYEQNVAFANMLEKQIPADDGWIAVVRFYAALQLMNAYLIDKVNVHLDLVSAAHDQRKKGMEKCPKLRDAPGKYRALKELSEGVRYDPEFEFADHHRQESKCLLAKISAIVEPKIKKN